MTLLPLVLLLASDPAVTSTQWSRSRALSFPEQASAVLPVLANRIEREGGVRTLAGRTVGSERRGATLLDTTVTISFTEDIAAAFDLPFAIAYDAPNAIGRAGNLGVNLTGVVWSHERGQIAIGGTFRGPTSSSSGIYALAWASDLTRFAPRTTTFGVAAQVEHGLGPMLLGATVASDVFLHPNAFGGRRFGVALSTDALLAAPLELTQTAKWTFLLVPTGEARAQSTLGSAGVSSEALVGGSLAFGAYTRTFSAELQSTTRAIISLGVVVPVYEAGPGVIDAAARLMLSFEFSGAWSSASFERRGAQPQ